MGSTKIVVKYQVKSFSLHFFSNQGPCEGDSGGPLYKIGWEFEDGSVTGRTLLGILRGGVGCGNPKLKDIPKWWMRVSKIVRCKGPSTS